MGLLSIISALLAEAFIVWILINNQKQIIEQQLKSTATTLISMGISDYHGLKGFQKMDDFIEKSLKLGTVNKVINVFTKKGKLMFSSHEPSEENFSEFFSSEKEIVFGTYRSKKRRYRVLTTPYKGKTGKIYYLQLAIPLPQFKDIIRSALLEGILLLLCLALLSFIISYFLAQRMTRPVRQIADHLRALDPSRLKQWQPLTISHAGEYLSDIVKRMNDLIFRVKNSLYRLSQTNRYLAHEIRNPLTILTGEAETVLAKEGVSDEEYQTALKSSLEEIERIDNVVTTVSRMTQVEGVQFNLNPCNLSVWFEERIPSWKKLLKDKLIWKPPPEEIIAVVDDDLLYRLIDNLIRNIHNHAPVGTKAEISLNKKEEKVEISIEDEGPGLTDNLLSALNKGKVIESMGVGLGLCLEIVSVCGFELNFVNKSPKGLKVTVGL